MPTFSSLPAPFFAELSSTLAEQRCRKSLASLNVTCKDVKEGTKAGLWKTCHFGKGYDWNLALVNEELKPLIKELWIETEVVPFLITTFPNLTTVVRTWCPPGGFRMDIDVIAFAPTPYSHLLDSIILATTSISNDLAFVVEHEAIAGLVLALQSSTVELFRFGFTTNKNVHIRVETDQDAVELLGALVTVMYDVRELHIQRRKCETYVNWVDKESQLKLISQITPLDQLECLYYSVEVPAPHWLATPSLGAITPDPDVLRALASEIGKTLPHLRAIGHTVRFNGRIDPNYHPSGWLRQDKGWLTKVVRGTGGQVSDVTVARADMPFWSAWN